MGEDNEKLLSMLRSAEPEMIAITGKKISQIMKEIQEEYGSCYMEERDYKFSQKKKEDRLTTIYYYTIKQSYKCYDSRNNYLAQPETVSYSAGTASAVGNSASVTLNYRYKAVVKDGDTCQVCYCKARIANGPGNTNLKETAFDCNQGVNSGSYQSISKALSLASNSASVPYYFYSLSVAPCSLILDRLKCINRIFQF